MNRHLKKHPGFTFIELLFAIVVMGTMFGLALVVFVGMLRFYVFSGYVRQNQENGRNVLDSISREIRYGQLVYPTDPGVADPNMICVYSNSTKKVIYYGFDPTKQVLERGESKATFESLKDAIDSGVCSATTTPGLIDDNSPIGSVKNILPKNMWAADFSALRTQGAALANNENEAALVIKLSFITKATQPVSGVCDVRDIYCNKNTYTTAVQIQGNNTP